MSDTIQIVGFTSGFKVPLFAAETIFGAGAVSQGAIPLSLLVEGAISDDGAYVENGTPVPIFDTEDADYYAGAGSEGARMLYAALLVPGVRVYFGGAARNGSAVAAEATITITGPATSSGEWRYRIAGVTVSGAIAVGQTATQIGAAIANAINNDVRLPVTAVNDAGEVTLTVKSAGVRGNLYILHQDTTFLATGVTSAIAGGASVTGGGVRFVSGAGADDVTTFLTAIHGDWYQRIAIAQNDATNLGRWRTDNNLKAGPLEGKMQHIVFATNGTFSAATTLSTATVNDPRFQQLWALNSENHPSELAAAMAALRTVTEQDDPAAAYDGVPLAGMAPQAFSADRAQIATQQACLDNGVTPLVTTADGKLTVCRSITTYCLRGTIPYYGTLDTSDSVVPDYVRFGLQIIWEQEFRVANKRVQDNPPVGAKEPPAGVATPARWDSRVFIYLKSLEERLILINVGINRPKSEYNTAAKRIMSIVPTVPAPNNHQIGVSIRQMAA